MPNNPFDQFDTSQQAQTPPDNPFGQFDVPQPTEPKTFQGFISNVGKDANEFMRGAGVLGSVGQRRFVESYVPGLVTEPHLLQDFKDAPGIDTFADAFFPKGAIQPDDLTTGGQIISSIGQHYLDNYIDPIRQGEFQKLADFAYDKPLTFASDLIPLGGPVAKGVKAGASAVSKMPMIANATQAAQTAIHNLPVVAPMVQAVQQSQQVFNAFNALNTQFVQQVMPRIQALDALWQQIPQDIRPSVLAAGEMRDPGLGLQLRQNPQVAAFLQAAADTDEFLANALVQRGDLTAAQVKLARYGPFAKTIFPNEATLTDDMLEIARITLDSQGIRPNYFGIMYEQEASKAQQLLSGHLTGKIAQTVRYTKARQGQADAPGWLRDRTANAGAGSRAAQGLIDDAMVAAKTRYLQGMAYMHMSELFQNLLNNPNYLAANSSAGALQSFNAAQHLQNIAMNAGLGAGAAANLIAQMGPGINNMLLPKQVVKHLNEILGSNKPGIIDKLTNTFKTLTLGLDMFWAGAQTVQNQMILPVAMFKGPRDVARSLLAYATVFDNDFKQLIKATRPDILSEINMESFAAVKSNLRHRYEPILEEMQFPSDLARPIAGIMAPLHWYMQRVFGAATAGDNFARLIKFSHELMRQADNSALRVPLRDAFSRQARHLQLRQALMQPAMVEAAAQDVFRWLGKYDAMTAQQWAGMRRLAPFWLWWMHSFSIAWSLPAEAPIKSVLLAKLTKVAPSIFQPEDMAETYKEGGAIPIKGKHGDWARHQHTGKPLIVMGAGFNPLMQPAELVQQARHLMYGGSEREGLPVFNAGINLVLMLTGRNPGSLSEFSNPHLYSDKGQHKDAQGEAHNLVPLPWSGIPGRLLAPKTDRQIREWLAYPYQPTDQTTLLNNRLRPDKAIAHDKKTGEKLKQWEVPILLMQQALKARPTEMRVTQGQESLNKIRSKASFRKTKARKQWVNTEEDPLF